MTALPFRDSFNIIAQNLHFVKNFFEVFQNLFFCDAALTRQLKYYITYQQTCQVLFSNFSKNFSQSRNLKSLVCLTDSLFIISPYSDKVNPYFPTRLVVYYSFFVCKLSAVRIISALYGAQDGFLLLKQSFPSCHPALLHI